MKVIVLDYSVPRVAVIKNVPAEVGGEGERLERFLEQNGFHCSNCSWMVTENDQCNEAEVFEFRPRAEHVGQFDINTHDYQEEYHEEEQPDYPREELAEGEELVEGEEIND
jgi:hypothetical protein